MPSFASVVQPRLRRKWERMQAEPFLTALYFRLCPLSSAISASVDFGERQEAGFAVRRGRAASEWLREPLLLAPSLRAERVGPADGQSLGGRNSAGAFAPIPAPAAVRSSSRMRPAKPSPKPG